MGDDARRRRRNIILIGAALVLSFLLPVVSVIGRAIHVSFPNIEGLWTAGLGPAARLLLLSPLVIGAAVIATGALAPVRARGLALIALGLLPPAILLPAPQVQDFLYVATTALSPEGWQSLALQASWGYLAWIGMLVGCRARYYRPRSRVACAFGVAGAAVCFMGLLLPFLPPEKGLLPLVAPFLMLRHGLRAVAGGGMILAIACTAAAGVVNLANHRRRSDERVEELATISFRLFVAGQVVGVAVLIFTMMAAVSAAGAGASIAFLLLLLKYATWGVGLALLVPVGIADLIVGDEKDRPVPASVVADPSGAPRTE